MVAVRTRILTLSHHRSSVAEFLLQPLVILSLPALVRVRILALPRLRWIGLRHLHEALRQDPAHGPANNMLAGYFYHSGMVGEALRYSEKAAAAA